MKIEAILLDLDGVAIHENKIVPGAIDAIRTAQESHIPIMPVTSRDFFRSQWIVGPLGFTEQGIFAGGAAIASFLEQDVLWQRGLNQDIATHVVSQLSPLSIRMNVGKGNNLVNDKNPVDDIGNTCLGIWAEIPIKRIPEAEIILSSLNQLFGLQHHYNHGTVLSDIMGVHITRTFADKFWTTRRLLRRLGIHPKNTIAIADGDNDIPLYRAVGKGIAMDNASPAVKAAADVITDHVLDRGLEKAIKRLLKDSDHGIIHN